MIKIKQELALRRKLSLRQEKINQKIYVRDIYILHPDRNDSTGERKRRYPDVETALKRMSLYVKQLAFIANIYHRSHHCEKMQDETFKIKESALNRITRVVLPEFSLFTRSPLSFSQYSQFTDDVLEIAKNNHENTHLLLSSLAVVTPDNVILNIALYIQCGEEPKIQPICKAHGTWWEEYENTVVFQQREDMWNSAPGRSAQKFEFSVNQNGLVIPSNSTFIVETAGGAQYIQSVDICKDNDDGHSQDLLIRSLHRDIHSDFTVFPFQADHIVTSNYLSIPRDQITEKDFVYVDAEYSLKQVKHDMSNNVKLAEIFNDLYTNQLVICENGFKMRSSIFGAPPHIIVTEERAMDKLRRRLYDYAKNKNKSTIKYLSGLYLSKNRWGADQKSSIDAVIDEPEPAAMKPLPCKSQPLPEKNKISSLFHYPSFFSMMTVIGIAGGVCLAKNLFTKRR